jgi:cytochrome c oxidase assembly factor CtaG
MGAMATITAANRDADHHRRLARPGALIAAGLSLLAVGMVGGERLEYLGAWVHVLQHLLLMAGGPVLIVEGLVGSALFRSGPSRSGLSRSGLSRSGLSRSGLSRSAAQPRSGTGRGALPAAIGYYAVQPLLLLTPWFGALELHPTLHLLTHLLLVALGLAYWYAVLGVSAADAAAARRVRIVVLAAVPVGLALAVALAFGPAVGSVSELRSAAWLVALAAVVPTLFALLRIDRPPLLDAEATAAVPGVPARTI